jgi:hypothetical protein
LLRLLALYPPFGLNALMRLGSCDTLFCVYGLSSALLIPFVSACVLPTCPPLAHSLCRSALARH